MREPTHADDPADGPRVSILLVDDQPANLTALDAVLEPLGQDLVHAASGEAALRHLLQRDFAVVLLDVQMQGLDGFTTAQFVRGRERSRHTPIIFLTAFESPQFTAAKAYSLGAVDYLLKPIVPEILRAKVAGFVELFRKTEEVKRQAEMLRRLQQQEFERQLATEALRRSEEHFRLMADSAPVLLWLADTQGRCTFFSKPWLEFTGRALEQELGEGWADGVHPDEREGCRATFRAALGGRKPFRTEYRLRRADGRYRWVLATGVPRQAPGGAFAGYIGSAIDITERRDAEEALRKAARDKDQYLATLAHELRNPLSPILTSLGLLEQAGSGPTRDQALQRIRRQVRHLARLVDDLLDVSRITLGKVPLRPERVDLARLVRVAAEDRRPALEQAGLSLGVEAPITPVWVRGDETRLAQVVNNLLDNAVKFTDRGGRVEVRLAVDAAGGEAAVHVSDTGIGLGPEIREHLFDVFSQGDHSLDRTRGGLGLGLAVVKGLVERHGGRVRADSAGPGRGAAFTVFLPAESEPAAFTEAPSPRNSANGAGGPRRRVLVVEDNKDSAESLSVLLELMGHEVRVAHAGPEGVEAGAAWRPEVVISDIGLPGFDGYEVARRLRAVPGLAGALLIALTGYGRDEDRRQSAEAGFDHHLVKPADPADLRRILAGKAPRPRAGAG
jgi:PAS domain S-box-containing protein